MARGGDDLVLSHSSPRIARFVVLGNPENRRVTHFCAAARSRGRETRVVSWVDLLAGTPLVAADDEIVRIESPGENWSVERQLIRRGRELRGEDPGGWDDADDRGRIRGIADACAGMVDAIRTISARRFVTLPTDVGDMFDKLVARRRLEALPQPPFYGIVRDYGSLKETLARVRSSRAFLKPRHGSSASGVVALRYSKGRVSAVTSVELDGDRLYNSLRIRRYDHEGDVARIIALLAEEDEILVEAWVPKANAQGSTYDLRVVCIAGDARHVVVRMGRSPMTNLHLGGRRGDAEALKVRLGDHWDEALAVARAAADRFPNALHVGVDVGLTLRSHRPVLFEVNAFGDLLPGVLDDAGRTTYEAEVDAIG